LLKPQATLNELELDSIDIMCPSIIDKYLNCPNHYEPLSLLEFFSFYTIKKNKIWNIANPKLSSL
jgi:hypothetical protein